MDGKGENGGVGGWAGWLLKRWRGAAQRPRQRLKVVERIALGPRQSLCLVEAEGKKILLATSGDGAPAFYALDASCAARQARRVTW